MQIITKSGIFVSLWVFLVCCDSAKKLRSMKSADIQMLIVSCGLGSWSFPCCRRANVERSFGCTQLCLSLWCLLWRQKNLNWSCKVLAEHSRKTPQKGFLPYLQLNEFAQTAQLLSRCSKKKKQANKSHWIRILNGSLISPGYGRE